MIQNRFIPTLVFDNFFDNPNWIRNYALSLEYHKDMYGRWPGERTKSLCEINKDLFNYIMYKFFAIFYPRIEPGKYDDTIIQSLNYSHDSTMYFQKINCKDYGKSGWIHRDDCLITGIIYLNDEYNSNSGTSIYDLKNGWRSINRDKKNDYYSGKLDEQTAEKYRLENNSQFEEIINLKNKFNRLTAFDSNLYHGANDFYSNNDDRLTLIFFVNKFFTQHTPIHRSVIV